MKAVLLRAEDGPDGLEYTDVPDPTPAADEVLIDVHSAGVSFVDLLMTRGQYQERPEVPFVPGIEVSGVVRQAPAGTFRIGDRVAAYILRGGYAEVAVAPVATTFRLPPELDHAAGTALALNYPTAHFALVRRGHLARGEHVLVHGASGGVGAAAIQLAKAMGAVVVAVVRTAEKASVATAAGADYVVVANEGWAAEARSAAPKGFALVVDPVGMPVFDDSVRLVATEGRYLVVGFAGAGIPTVKTNRILLRNIDIAGVGWGAFQSGDKGIAAVIAADLTRMAAEGVIAPAIGRHYQLADAANALRDLDNHSAVGKLVLDVAGSA
jgi:NADPH2:quinone reductase